MKPRLLWTVLPLLVGLGSAPGQAQTPLRPVAPSPGISQVALPLDPGGTAASLRRLEALLRSQGTRPLSEAQEAGPLTMVLPNTYQVSAEIYDMPGTGARVILLTCTEASQAKAVALCRDVKRQYTGQR